MSPFGTTVRAYPAVLARVLRTLVCSKFEFRIFMTSIFASIFNLLKFVNISNIFTGGSYNIMTNTNVTPSISSGFNRRRNAIVGGLAFLTAVHVIVLLSFKNSVRCIILKIKGSSVDLFH